MDPRVQSQISKIDGMVDDYRECPQRQADMLIAINVRTLCSQFSELIREQSSVDEAVRQQVVTTLEDAQSLLFEGCDVLDLPSDNYGSAVSKRLARVQSFNYRSNSKCSLDSIPV